MSDERIIALTKTDFVPVFVSLYETKVWPKEHGVHMTPQINFTDAEGQSWGFLQDAQPVEKILAEAKHALELMKAGADAVLADDK